MPFAASAPLNGKSMPIFTTFADVPAALEPELDVDEGAEHAAVRAIAASTASRDERRNVLIYETGSLTPTATRFHPRANRPAHRKAETVNRMRPWTIAVAIVAIVLLLAAVSHSVYEITSPIWLSWHVVLRKAYSIVAFATVGYALRRALAENGRTKLVLPCILWLAAYSATIEVLQFAYGSKEGLGWNTFDTFCGALGGALATIDLWTARLRTSAR